MGSRDWPRLWQALIFLTASSSYDKLSNPRRRLRRQSASLRRKSRLFLKRPIPMPDEENLRSHGWRVHFYYPGDLLWGGPCPETMTEFVGPAAPDTGWRRVNVLRGGPRTPTPFTLTLNRHNNALSEHALTIRLATPAMRPQMWIHVTLSMQSAVCVDTAMRTITLETADIEVRERISYEQHLAGDTREWRVLGRMTGDATNLDAAMRLRIVLREGGRYDFVHCEHGVPSVETLFEYFAANTAAVFYLL
ncbi:hypothetical protein DFJ77DRAFT_368873 [Powellomyces hirtus]|nr:hypothetical protein DFJ77DRAFT_368873 [Powellomyces hirtus]